MLGSAIFKAFFLQMMYREEKKHHEDFNSTMSTQDSWASIKEVWIHRKAWQGWMWNQPSNADDGLADLWGTALEMRVSVWRRAMAFLEGQVNFHMGSWSRQPPGQDLWGGHRETGNHKWEQKLFMWPDAYQTAQCALYPAGERSSARGSGAGAVHADTW